MGDRTAIENLIFRYARYVDTAQYEALGELFAAASITANKTDAPLVGRGHRRVLAVDQQAL